MNIVNLDNIELRHCVVWFSLVVLYKRLNFSHVSMTINDLISNRFAFVYFLPLWHVKRDRGWRTFKRPGVDAFLEHMAKFYEIIVYSDQLPTVSMILSQLMTIFFILLNDWCYKPFSFASTVC